MPKANTNKQPNTMDMPLNGQKGEATEPSEIVQQIPVEQLHPFKNHPFKVLDDDAMQQSVESIRQYGVMAPLIARPREGGGYEIISGHRRKYAAEQAGLRALPVIVRPMDDNAAVILMVDSNLQREGLLPSERAFAYKMKMEAIKHQGKRTDLTSGQVGQKSESLLSSNLIAQQTGDSSRNVHRYIRLTYLIPALLEMVDQKKIAFNPAVELSYLTEAEQKDFMEAMGDCQNTPSLSQAQRIKWLSREGQCTYEAMFAIMGEAKKDELDKVTISNDVLRQYFPRSYTPRQMQDTIIKLLQQWQRKRQREQSR
jgi:ParB family chromosome partitioning protein